MSDSLIVTFDIENRPALQALEQMRTGFRQLGESVKTAISPGAKPDEQVKILDGVNDRLMRQKELIKSMESSYGAMVKKVEQTKLLLAQTQSAQQPTDDVQEQLNKEIQAREAISKRIDGQIGKLQKLQAQLERIEQVVARAKGLGVDPGAVGGGMASPSDLPRMISEISRKTREAEKRATEAMKRAATKGIGGTAPDIEAIRKSMASDGAQFGDPVKMEAHVRATDEIRRRANESLEKFVQRRQEITRNLMQIESFNMRAANPNIPTSEPSLRDALPGGRTAINPNNISWRNIAPEQSSATERYSKLYEKWKSEAGLREEYEKELSSLPSRPKPDFVSESDFRGMIEARAKELTKKIGDIDSTESEMVSLSRRATQDLTGDSSQAKQLVARTEEFNRKMAELEAERVEMVTRHGKRTNAERARFSSLERERNRKEVSEVEDYNRRLASLLRERGDVANRYAMSGLQPTALLQGNRAVANRPGVMDRLGAVREAAAPMGAAAVTLGGRMKAATEATSKFVGLPFKALGFAADGLNKMSFGLWKMTSGLQTVTGLWQSFMAQVTRGEEFARVQYAFETMTKGIGLSLEGLRKSSGGLLADKDLMKMSTFGTQAGMKASDIEMMTKRAQGASLITGRDMSDIMRRMTMGVGKREREVMDELTVLMPNASEIWRDKAKKEGKSTDQLTEAEKTQAYIAAFEKSSRHLDKAASNLPESLTKVQKFQAGINNLMDQFSVKIMRMATDSGLLEKVGAMVGTALDGVANFFNESGLTTRLADWMPAISEILGGIGTAVSELAPLLDLVGPTLKMIANLVVGLLPAFSLLAKAVGIAAQALLVIFNGALLAVAASLNVLVGWIPGLGDALDGLEDAAAKNVKVLADMSAKSKDLGGQITDLTVKTNGVNGAFQSQITTLSTLNNAMSAYQTALDSAGTSAEKMGRKVEAALEILKKGPGALAEAGGMTTILAGVAEARAMAEVEKAKLQAELKKAGMQDVLGRMEGAKVVEEKGWGSSFIGSGGKMETRQQYVDASGKGIIPEGERSDDVALWGYVGPDGQKRNLTYADLHKMTEEFKKAEQNITKMTNDAAGSAKKLSASDWEGFVTGGMEDIKVKLPTIKAEKYQPKSLQDVAGRQDRLNPGMTLPLMDGNMNEGDKARFLDALSVDMDARPGIDHPYEEAATRTNINAMENLRLIREEEVFRIGQEITGLLAADHALIEQYAGATLSAEQVEEYRQKFVAGLRANQESKDKQATEALDLRDRLKDRLPPPKGSGSGKKKEEDRIILPELIRVANQSMSEAEAVIMGKSAFMGEGFSYRLASETADVVMLGLEDSIKYHLDDIEDAAERMVDLAGKAVEKGVASGSIEEFKRFQDAFQAVIASGEQSGVMDYVKNNEKYRKAIEAFTKKVELEGQMWEAHAQFSQAAAEAAKRAADAQFELQQKRDEYALQEKEHIEKSYIDFNGSASGEATISGHNMLVNYQDLPDHLKRKAFDERMEFRRREVDRQIEEIKKQQEEARKALQQQFALGGSVSAGLGGLTGGLMSVDDEAESKIAGLEADFGNERIAKQRQVIEEYAAGMNQTFGEMHEFMAEMVVGDSVYAIVDSFSVWQNSTLTMTEDWKANMHALLEDMFSSTGEQLAKFTESLVMFETGSGLVSKTAGAAVSGLFRGLMSLFRIKENKEKEERRAAEREMRRKETRKVAEFSVTVINQSLPVTHVIQQQMTKNLAAFLRAGGKIKGMGA